jgi:hypothetical protein
VDKHSRIARNGDSAVNAFTNRGAETRSPREELEVGSLDDLGAGLTDVTMTRSRAIKLAGAALAGSALSLVWAGEADARRRRRRRRRRRKVQVTNSLPVTLVLGGNTLNAKNPGNKALTIDKVKVLDSDSEVIAVKDLVGGPVTIEPDETLPVTVDIDANDLVNADKLRLIDDRGVAITVIDKDGVEVGDIDVL